MNINKDNNANFNELTAQAINQANPNFLASHTVQNTTSKSSLAEYEITTLDIKTREILTNIEDVLTCSLAFIKLCVLDNQQLAAEHLNNMLQKQYTITIRKWALTPCNYYPLIIASEYLNVPIYKVILNKVENSTYFDQYIDKFYGLSTVTDISYRVIEEFYKRKNIKKYYTANDCTLEKYIYSYLLPKIKQQDTTGLYCKILFKILEHTKTVDIFDLIYQDINSLDKNILKEYSINHTLRNALGGFRCDNNQDGILYILDKTNFFKEGSYLDYKKQYLFRALEKKQFYIASKILKQLPKNILNNIRMFVYVSSMRKSFEQSIFNLVIKFLNIETLVFLLNTANLSIKEDNIFALNYAILNNKYTAAYVLKAFDFKYKRDNSLEQDNRLTQEEYNKIQDFINKQDSLSKRAAVVLGINYIEQQVTIKQAKEAIVRYNPRAASKVKSIEDIFSLNYTY